MSERSRRSRSSQPESIESPASPRLRSRSRRSKNLSGLDISEVQDDDEYEHNAPENFNSEEELNSDEDLDEDEEVEAEDEKSPRRSKSKKRSRGSNSEDEEDISAAPTTTTPSSRIRKKAKSNPRGRKGPPQTLADDDGNPLEVEDDEIVMDDDPDGETKIDKMGNLRDGREFRVRTFTVKGKGNRLYMLSTEPARCMGFRDSYLLFQKHKHLFKLVIDNEEKYDLIERRLIPHSYKGRSISLVTARSIFREFGARIIVGGKKVVDDYYESKSLANGNVRGELADPSDNIPTIGKTYNKNQYVAWHGASQVYNTSSHASTPTINQTTDKHPFMSNGKVNDENWMYQHAFHARAYDTQLFLNRQELYSKGVKDPYTGLKFLPVQTQPKNATITKLSDSVGPKLIFDTVLVSGDISFKRTGLKNIPPEIFESVDEETKKAILKQQELEKLYS